MDLWVVLQIARTSGPDFAALRPDASACTVGSCMAMLAGCSKHLECQGCGALCFGRQICPHPAYNRSLNTMGLSKQATGAEVFPNLSPGWVTNHWRAPGRHPSPASVHTETWWFGNGGLMTQGPNHQQPGCCMACTKRRAAQCGTGS